MAVRKDEKTKKWYFYGKYKDPITNKYKDYKRRGFRTKQEAKFAESEFLKNFLAEQKGSILMSRLIDEYFSQKKKEMKKSSYNSLVNKTNKHIRPYFNNMIINDIKPIHIRKWKDKMNAKNLSLRYKRDIFIMLSTIFNFSEKYYGTENNCLKLEGNFKDPTEQKKEMLFWTLEEFEQFDNVIDDLEYKTLFNFLYWTGCRRGEALALNWNDFTSGFKTVKIRKTINQKIKGQPYEITTPKTPGSNRNIPLPDQLINLIQRLYECNKEIEGFNDNCFVFGLEKPLSDTTIERKKNEYCKIANVKQIRIHDFRHSHASYLINNMPNDQNLILAISKRLGHSSPTITLQVYAHMMPNDDDKLLNIMNNK